MLLKPWQEIIQAAEEHYDRTESVLLQPLWVMSGLVQHTRNNLHRNIIFETSNIPYQPISFYEAPTPSELWKKLDLECSKDCNYG